MKKIILILMMLICSGCSNLQSLTKTDFYLDTEVTITLQNGNNDILNHCFDICKKYELIFSKTNPDSELYKLNNSDKTNAIEISKELSSLIQKGLYYSKLSHGSFDITIGSLSNLWDFKSEHPQLPDNNLIVEQLSNVNYQDITLTNKIITYNNSNIIIDLGGIAKGYIADKIKDYLIKQDVEGIIDLGGNILCVGDKGGKNYKVGIQDPTKSRSDTIQVLSINDKSVVTSGNYERYFILDGIRNYHIINPKTGYPYSTDVASTTIISSNSVDGDALSTICFTLGKDEAIKFINGIKDIECIVIDNDNQISYSKNAKEYLIQ